METIYKSVRDAPNVWVDEDTPTEEEVVGALTPLVDQLAELKMLRTLQLRVNHRTKQLAQRIEGEQATEGADVVRMSSAEFGAFIASELTKWGRVVREAGIKPQ